MLKQTVISSRLWSLDCGHVKHGHSSGADINSWSLFITFSTGSLLWLQSPIRGWMFMVTLKILSVVFCWKLVTQQRRGLKTVIISEGLQNKLSCWAGGEWGELGFGNLFCWFLPPPSLHSFTSEEYWLSLSKDFKINWSIKKLNKELIKRKFQSFYTLSALAAGHQISFTKPHRSNRQTNSS